MTTTAPPQIAEALNYVDGEWRKSAAETLNVVNPATAEIIGRVPLSTAAEVNAAVEAAERVKHQWRRTPPGERVQYLFRLKNLLEENLDELARIITLENGKTFPEARAELRRAIENVEVACGIPMMMQGYNLEDVTPGVDEMQIRQPLGVVAAIVPFNFPAMVSYWFLPYAIACGNTFILKPSERVPLSMHRAFELLEKTGLPKGVVNLVNGGKDVVNALCSQRQAHAVPGRRKKSRHCFARRGHGTGHANYQRQRLRLRRPALPRRFRRRHHRPSPKNFSRFHRPRRFRNSRRQRPRRRRANGPGHH